MNTPKARGGFMPTIQKFEDERIEAKISFGDIRRHKILQWFPYLTGCKPKLCLLIKLKDTTCEITRVGIECDRSTGTSNGVTHPEDYGCRTRDIQSNGLYERTLPLLDSGGEYKYYLNILMKKGQYEITSGDKIMSTGYVFDRGMVIMNLAFLVIGGLLGKFVF